MAQKQKVNKEEIILDYFDYEGQLWEVADRITEFTPLKSKYLNKDEMRDDVYEKLEDYFFSENYDWDELTSNDNIENEYEERDFSQLSKNIYLDILTGVDSSSDKGKSAYHCLMNIVEDKGHPEIMKLCRETFLQLVNEYRELRETLQ